MVAMLGSFAIMADDVFILPPYTRGEGDTTLGSVPLVVCLSMCCVSVTFSQTQPKTYDETSAKLNSSKMGSSSGCGIDQFLEPHTLTCLHCRYVCDPLYETQQECQRYCPAYHSGNQTRRKSDGVLQAEILENTPHKESPSSYEPSLSVIIMICVIGTLVICLTIFLKLIVKPLFHWHSQEGHTDPFHANATDDIEHILGHSVLVHTPEKESLIKMDRKETIQTTKIRDTRNISHSISDNGNIGKVAYVPQPHTETISQQNELGTDSSHIEGHINCVMKKSFNGIKKQDIDCYSNDSRPVPETSSETRTDREYSSDQHRDSSLISHRQSAIHGSDPQNGIVPNTDNNVDLPSTYLHTVDIRSDPANNMDNVESIFHDHVGAYQQLYKHHNKNRKKCQIDEQDKKRRKCQTDYAPSNGRNSWIAVDTATDNSMSLHSGDGNHDIYTVPKEMFSNIPMAQGGVVSGFTPCKSESIGSKRALLVLNNVHIMSFSTPDVDTNHGDYVDGVSFTSEDHEDNMSALCLSLHSEDEYQAVQEEREIQHESSTSDRDRRWNEVLRVYDIIEVKLPQFPWIIGCMLSSDTLELVMDTSKADYDVDTAHDRICQEVPVELHQYILITTEGPSIELC